MSRLITLSALALAAFTSSARAHTDDSIPPHVREDIAIRCNLDAGCETKAIAYIHKTDYCEIKKLTGSSCKCPGRDLTHLGLCEVATATISHAAGDWREVSLDDFQFSPQLRLYEVEVSTNGELFGVYTNKIFRNARWARYVCSEGPDDDELKFELEDCGPGQAKAVTHRSID